jgi:hypothetical protein
VSATIRRTWTAADACGHVVSGVQTITLVDSTSPRLTVPADAVVECGHSTETAATGYALADDLCSTPVVAYSDDAHLTDWVAQASSTERGPPRTLADSATAVQTVRSSTPNLPRYGAGDDRRCRTLGAAVRDWAGSVEGVPQRR